MLILLCMPFIRMANRQGLLSDNDKNFVAADKELREMTSKW